VCNIFYSFSYPYICLCCSSLYDHCVDTIYFHSLLVISDCVCIFGYVDGDVVDDGEMDC
jgi:hypothetical protein